MLQNLLEQLRNAGTGSKVIAGLVVVALVAIVATAAVVAQKPHFELLYSELDASTSAKVQKALAAAGIPYEASQPPGPFMVYVDDSDRYRAMHAVAGSGALDRTPGGILPTDSGLQTVFMSADERAQVTLKRQWQELERQLEVFEFVADATVTTTPGNRTPFGDPVPRTASVLLQLRGTEALSRAQARSVANQVRFSLGIDARHLTIADQRGESLYDGTDGDHGSGQWLEQKAYFERDLEQRANAMLSAALGPDRARVTVSSTWNQDLTTTVAESADADNQVLVSERTDSTQTPVGSARRVGGPAGPGTNSGFGVDNAAAPEEGEQPEEIEPPEPATTDFTERDYWTPRESRRTVRVAPVLERLSVSLFLDQRMFAADEDFAARKAELEESVKAAVGFDPARNDTFSSVSLEFFVPETPEGGAEEAVTVTPPNPMVEMLLERGVEIVSAIAFLFLLSRALRSKPTKPEPEPASIDGLDTSEDTLELLAQAQIEELVKTDPARVGQILSSWVADEKAAAG